MEVMSAKAVRVLCSVRNLGKPLTEYGILCSMFDERGGVSMCYISGVSVLEVGDVI